MLRRSRCAMARCAAFTAALLYSSLVARVVLAQQATRPAPPVMVAPDGPPGAPPATPVSDSREEALTVAGGYTCVVGEHAGVENDDARTTADVICHGLAAHSAHPGAYDIRLGKLGGKILLVLTERATGAERRVFIQGVEEVPVASERLIAALVENKSARADRGRGQRGQLRRRAGPSRKRCRRASSSV